MENPTLTRDNSAEQVQSKAALKNQTFPDEKRSPTQQAAILPRFVVYKPAARNSHFDFRLELGGVLKSWAIPNGPSPDPSDKRLAVHMDDQPIEEHDPVETSANNGQQSLAAVQIWDKGTWQPFGDAAQSYAEGKIRFILRGQKMRGNWELIRIAPRKPGRQNGKENWLLTKSMK